MKRLFAFQIGLLGLVFLFCIFSADINSASRYSAEEEFFAMQEQVVVSASKRAQKISDAPVAISVVTREEIENLGVQSIAEALRMVAGVYVQTVTSGQYEVALRGTCNIPPTAGPFSAMSRSILVLIDGRSFFNDAFGGTIWEFLPITLNDIERIEIVRGPASALFGANAATGVINIITRDPEKIKNEFVKVSTSFGNDGKEKHNFYYADKIDNLFVSVSAERSVKENRFGYKEFDQTKMTFVPGRGDRADDNFRVGDEKPLKVDKGMMNFNYKINEKSNFDLKAGMSTGFQNYFGGSGDFLSYKCATEEKYAKLTYQTKIEDNIIKLTYSRVNMKLGESDGQNEGNNDDNVNDELQNGLGIVSDDIELQSIINIKADKDILVAGLNYRDANAKSEAVYFMKNKGIKNQNFKAAYLNNEYSFIKDKLKLITACRMDIYNIPDITEYSPQIALFYKQSEKNIFKLNYSEAIRTPFIVELNLSTFTSPAELKPLKAFGMDEFIRWYATQDLKAPRVKGYELGYQTKFSDKANGDITVFTHKVEDLITFVPEYGDPFNIKHVTNYLTGQSALPYGPVFSQTFKNITDDYKTYGVELNYKMLIANKWNLWSNFTYQSMKLGSQDIDFTPGKLANVGISGKVTDKLKLSLSANYASKADMPVQNGIDRNLDLLTLDKSPTASSLTTAFAKYMTYGDSLGTSNMTAIPQTIKNLYTSGDPANQLQAQNLFHACLGADGSGSATDSAARAALKGVSPNLTSTEMTYIYGITSGILASSLSYESLLHKPYEKTDEYLLFNARVAYSINDTTEFAFTGLNLFDKRHREYAYGEELGASYMATLSIEF